MSTSFFYSRLFGIRAWYLIALAALGLAAPIRAEVIYEATVRANSSGFPLASDAVFETFNTSADIANDYLAVIAGQSIGSIAGVAVTYGASAAIGRFGSVGLDSSLRGSTYSPASHFNVFSSVQLFSDEYINLTGFPAQAAANFVIDGGRMTMGAVNASIEFHLGVSSSQLIGAPFGARFSSDGTFAADASGNTTFTTSGEDIGATLINPGEVEIPLSFQTLDIGIVQPNERFELFYSVVFDLELNSDAFNAFLTAQFSDPLNLSLTPVLDIQFTPIDDSVPDPVAEPTTIALILLGFGQAIGIGYQRRKSRRLTE